LSFAQDEQVKQVERKAPKQIEHGSRQKLETPVKEVCPVFLLSISAKCARTETSYCLFFQKPLVELSVKVEKPIVARSEQQ